jgi:hypothetical protein
MKRTSRSGFWLAEIRGWRCPSAEVFVGVGLGIEDSLKIESTFGRKRRAGGYGAATQAMA